MKKTGKIVSASLIIMLCVSSCTKMQETFKGVGETFKEVVFDPLAALPDLFKANALEHEKKGELQSALLNWRVAQKIAPGDTESPEKIRTLEALAKKKAEEHFRKGLSYYERNAFEAACKEFMTVLRYDPDYKDALDYLKEKINGRTRTTYTVEKGDTLRSIARKVYKDPEKDFLIAYFNDMDEESQPAPGIVLNLPLLRADAPKEMPAKQPGAKKEKPVKEKKKAVAAEKEKKPAKKEKKRPEKKKEEKAVKKDKSTKKEEPPAKPEEKPDKPAEKPDKPAAKPEEKEDRAAAVEKELAKAKRLFESGLYRKAVSAAGKVLSMDASNAQARELRSASYYQMGKSLIRQEKYPEALNMLNKAGSGYKDTGELISEMRRRVKKKAEIHYRRGVRHFINEQLPEAIAEWEKTLSLNPNHQKAREDIRKARELMNKKPR